MKKIVALVLSLVMALSLCTVAFGYTGTVVYDLKDNGSPDTDAVLFYGADLTTYKAHKAHDVYKGNIQYYSANVTCYEVSCPEAGSFDGFVSEAEAKAFATENNWYGAGYTVTVEAYSVTVYLIPCTKDDASLAMYKNGAIDTWLDWSLSDDVAFYDVVGTAQKATTAKPNCTTSQFLEDGYVGDDGHYYVSFSDSKTKLNVDGKIVYATNVDGDPDCVIWASHIFAKGVANDKTGYDVATCLICKGEFACTNDEVVATKNGYKISTGFEYVVSEAKDVYEANAYDNGYDFAWGQTYATNYKFCWQLKAGTTEEIGATTTTTVDTNKEVNSAKTFDAGIAMYVGMSLMSVAGTAVVIGKKKEF